MGTRVDVPTSEEAYVRWQVKLVTEAIVAAVGAEREACARLVEEVHKEMPGSPTFYEALAFAAKAIRGRRKVNGG